VRRVPHSAVARDHPRHLSARAARQGDGAVGHRVGVRHGDRPHGRRLRHRVHDVALHLLHQRALRCARTAGRGFVRARDGARSAPAPGLVRLPLARAGHRCAADDARPGPAPRLVRVGRDRGAGVPRRGRPVPLRRSYRRTVSSPCR
jgi:hypothetical protein